MNYDDYDNEDIESVLEKIKDKGRGTRRRRTIIARTKLSAVVLSVAIVGGFSYFLLSRYAINSPVPGLDEMAVSETTIDKPILRLANDERVLLGEAQSNYSINTGDNVNITTDSDNTVRYTIDPETDLTNKEPEWDQVIIPRRGFVRLELADGTIVHVNSSSTLEFPRFFNGDKRIVKLTGEAYFEVEHDPTKPFIVETESMNISVLGTSFNVCSYENEHNITATLVEGSVTVFMGDDISTTLRPGQQAFITKEGALATRNVDVTMFTSWMHGKFIFNNSRLEDICFQVARWYDTDIHFDLEDLKNVRFTGIMLRDKPISELIKMMEKTSAVRFKNHENGYMVVTAK